MPRISLRLPDDLHAALRDAAQADNRSINGFLLRLIQTAVSRSRSGARR